MGRELEWEGVRMRGHFAVRFRGLGVGVLVTILSVVGAAAPAPAEPVGAVSGIVRTGGLPVANAWVTLMPVTASGNWAGRPIRTTTDGDGRYQFADLVALHAKVQVRAPSSSGLANAYWPGVYSFASAGILPVASSASTADVELPVAKSISGRVVDLETGAPVVGAQVQAHVDAPPGWEPVGWAGLAPGPGQFVIDGVPPVAVALQVRVADGSNYLGQWYDGAGYFGAADRVQPGTADIVIGLREGGEVGGVVRDDLGVAVPGAAVTIVGCPALCPMGAIADDSGAYRITGVPPGPGLRAYADATSAGLLNEWYAAPGQGPDGSFDLVAGQVRPDVDFSLTAGALLSGQILDGQTGDPVPGVSVDLIDVEDPLNSFVSRTVDAPATSADLVIGPVPPGSYSLIIYPGPDYLPVEIVASAGLDGAGLVHLARGERGEFAVSLARSGAASTGGGGAAGSGGPVGARPEPVDSAGWPGLFGGFLAGDGIGFLRLGA